MIHPASKQLKHVKAIFLSKIPPCNHNKDARIGTPRPCPSGLKQVLNSPRSDQKVDGKGWVLLDDPQGGNVLSHGTGLRVSVPLLKPRLRPPAGKARPRLPNSRIYLIS